MEQLISVLKISFDTFPFFFFNLQDRLNGKKGLLLGEISLAFPGCRISLSKNTGCELFMCWLCVHLVSCELRIAAL